MLSAHLAIPRSKYHEDRQVAAFCARVLERINALPGVVSAGMVNRLPLGGVVQIGSIQFENVDAGEARLPSADWRTVTPGYFVALGIPLREGRDFTEHDAEGAPPAGAGSSRSASPSGPRTDGWRCRHWRRSLRCS